MKDPAPQFLPPTPDVLDGWVAQTLPLRPDGTTPGPVATLVHRGDDARTAVGARRAVLYIHGFVDYFFQTHHALTWEGSGFAFYALDLRDYGRSIREGREPNWVLDLATYDEEISAALAHLRRSYDEVVLAGHSTGGLIVSLYASQQPQQVAGVVLNSISQLGSGYGHSLHVSTGGAWDYNLDWKPLEGFGVFAGWLAAVLRGHHQVARGLEIPVPVFMATSGAGGDNNAPTRRELATTDVVLSPPQMWRRAAKLGRDITVVRVNGGRHDLTLSREGARELFARELSAWLADRFPAAKSSSPVA